MMKTMKNRFPFRLGTTSYILPADLLTNVRFLAPYVDDIELILFEADDQSNLPDRNAITELHSLARSHDLSYTVHLPLGLTLGATEEEERRTSVAKALRVVELTSPLNPAAYVVHFEGDRRGLIPSEHMTGWTNSLRASVKDLLKTGIPSPLFCVETLDYPFALVDPAGSLVGFGQTFPRLPQTVHLGRIILSPAVRGQGLGRVLVRALVDSALERFHPAVITLNVYCDNLPAVQLYRSLGFTVSDENPDHRSYSMRLSVDSL